MGYTREAMKAELAKRAEEAIERQKTVGCGPTKGMTAAELLDEMEKRKILAFDKAMMLSKLEAKAMSYFGFEHPFDLITYAATMNEARMKDWERNNA